MKRMKMSEDFWLLSIEIDPEKLKPRRLDQDEYDEMHTALDSIRKTVEMMEPEKLKEIIGAVDVVSGEEQGHLIVTATSTPPSIYRSHADIWKCHDCKDRGDKWYMQDHRCNKSKSKELASLKSLQGQRKAARIKKLEKEHIRLDDD